jgi:hypothetical protein
MKKTSSFIMIMAALVCLCIQQSLAQNLAAPYLQFSTSAEASAYGNAFTSLADDASATYWNPAGLTGVQNYSFVGLVSAGLGLDRNFNAASVAINLQKQGVLGISFSTSGVSNIQGYDDAGLKTSSFNVVNIVPGISYAIKPTPDISAGATIRYIRQSLDVQVDNGYSFDAGLRYQFGTTRIIYTSAVVQNLFGKVGVNQLPQVLRLGIGSVFQGAFTGGIDYVVEDISNSKSLKYFNVGVGYQMNFQDVTVAARTGFNNGQDFSAGFGVGMNVQGIAARVDYAYVTEPSQLFTYSHRIGISIGGK